MTKDITLTKISPVVRHFTQFEHDPKKRYKLLHWATDTDENHPIRIKQAAIQAIIHSGTIQPEEVTPLFNLVKDDYDFPITGKNKQGKELGKDDKENDAYLRSEAALVLAKFGGGLPDYVAISPEFIGVLIEILERMENDLRFIPTQTSANYYFDEFICFLSALYLAEKNGGVPEEEKVAPHFMKKYKVSDESVLNVLNIK